MCNIRKRLWKEFLDAPVLFVFFSSFLFFFFFFTCPPPHYWCWLAVSRSNNMAEWFSKNTVVAVRLFRGSHSGEEADSHWWGVRRVLAAQTGPLTDTSWGAGVSSLLGETEETVASTRNMSGWAATVDNHVFDRWKLSVTVFYTAGNTSCVVLWVNQGCN